MIYYFCYDRLRLLRSAATAEIYLLLWSATSAVICYFCCNRLLQFTATAATDCYGSLHYGVMNGATLSQWTTATVLHSPLRCYEPLLLSSTKDLRYHWLSAATDSLPRTPCRGRSPPGHRVTRPRVRHHLDCCCAAVCCQLSSLFWTRLQHWPLSPSSEKKVKYEKGQ